MSTTPPTKKLVNCPRCKLQNPANAVTCLSCKAALPKEAPPPPPPAPPPPVPEGSGVVENSLMMGMPASKLEVAPSPRIVRSPSRSFDRSKGDANAAASATAASAPTMPAAPVMAPAAPVYAAPAQQTYAVYATQPGFPGMPPTVMTYFQGMPGMVFPPGVVPPGVLPPGTMVPAGVVPQVVAMPSVAAQGMPGMGVAAPSYAPPMAPPPAPAPTPAPVVEAPATTTTPASPAPRAAVARREHERVTQPFMAVRTDDLAGIETDPNPTKPVTTRLGRVDERVLHPPPTPQAPRAVSYVVARSDDPRALAWLACDPLPPIPVGLTPMVSIGRSVTCDLVLPHSSVSRTHAVIKVVGQRLLFEDRSSYGSFVNGGRTSSVEIKAGDTITIGPYEITVRSRADQKPASSKLEDSGETRPLGASIKDLDTADAMSGRLEKQPLTEVLQSLEFNEKTGTLEVHSGGVAGKLVIYQGAPMFATFGPLAGEGAVHAMVQLTEGYYAFRKNVEPGERNVNKRLTAILLDASREQDENG